MSERRSDSSVATIVAAIIGALATIMAAVIGVNVGKAAQQQQVVNVLIDKTGTDDYDETMKIIQSKVDEGEKAQASSSKEIDDLKAKVQELNQEIEEKKQENEELNNANKLLDEENKNLERDNQELQEKQTDLETKNTDLSKENGELRKLCNDNGINPNQIMKSNLGVGTGVALTELTDLERNRGYGIKTGSEAATKDDSGVNYSYGISCGDGTSTERIIEYRVDKKYKSLTGTLFVTAYGAGEYDGDKWDVMSFTIYADNKEIFPGDEYSNLSYSKQMPAQSIVLPIENVTYLRFVFNSASGREPLICFGNPRVYE